MSSQHSDGTLVAMPAICNGGVAGDWKMSNMNSMKLVIPLHSLYWSIPPKMKANAEPRLLSSLV